MRKRINIPVGTVFGRLTIVGYSIRKPGTWLCICTCGNNHDVEGHNLRNGSVSSCGCLRKELLSVRGSERNRSQAKCRCFSDRKNPAYAPWKAMHTRCTNSNRDDWPRYGGRGISVCERWNVFDNFLADMGERPIGTSIDRIDNDGNYEPSNCRWSDSKTQRNNSSTVRIVEYRGERMPISYLAKKVGIARKTLWGRINSGMTVEEAIAIPLRKSTEIT